MRTEVRDIYDDHAEWFDSARDKSLIERVYLDAVVTRLPENGTVLDIGCGTGEPIARHFISHGRRLTGIDIAPAMIGLCQKRFPDGDFRVMDMRHMDMDGTFDALIAWDSFFHLTQDEQRAMFPLFARHARAGTTLLFNTGTENGEAWGDMQGRPLHHASLSLQEYKNLLGENGFSIILHKATDAACGGRTVWLAQKEQ